MEGRHSALKGECVSSREESRFPPADCGKRGGQRTSEERRCIVDVNFIICGSAGSSCRAGGERAAGLPCVSSECTRMLPLQQGKERAVISTHGMTELCYGQRNS